MTSVNKLLPINIKGTNDITGTYSTVCLLANANTELSGNTYTKALAVACDLSASYVLTLSGDTFLRGRTDVSGSLYVNGTQITGSGGGGGSQDLSSVLFYGTNANNQVIRDLSGLVSTNLDISANTVFNQSYMPGRLENINTATTATFNMVFPLHNYYNFYNNGTTVVNLPSITTLTGNQQTQLTLNKSTGGILNIYPSAANTLRLPNGSTVANYLWNTPTNMLVIHCSVVSGGTWRISYVETPGNDTLGDVMLRGNQASTYLDMNFNSIDNASSVNATDMTSTNLISANQLYTENFYYSNISADIAITNWQAQTPNYSPTNGLYLQYVGSATYTGTAGIVTSGSALYVFQIVRGVGNAAYFLTYFPPGTTSQQAFTMQASVNQTFTFKTINYSLQPGQYIWGCWYQSQQNVSATLNTFIKTTGGTILAQEAGVFPGNDFPNWIFKSLPFTIATPTDVFFEATSVARSFNSSVVITGLELTQTGAMVVTDTVTNKTATISGTQSFLNSLYVNSGLQVDSGGIDVVGGISTSTAFGSSNISINSPYGSTSKANNSGDIISIGSAVNQDMSSNVLGNYRVIAIGNGANTGIATLQDAVSIGYNSRCSGLYSVAIGSRAQAKGNYTVAIAPDALAGSNEGCIGGSNAVLGFGACGSSVYNGFSVLSSIQNVYVGTRAGYNAADNQNTGIGFQALWQMNGRNGVTANGNSGKITQKNTALGYNAGALRTGYNNCTFLGAEADASVENLVNATAIGWGAQVDVSNCIVLGSTGTKTKVTGDLFGVTTINGAAYPPISGAGNLATVLQAGNKASTFIDLSGNNIISTGKDSASNTVEYMRIMPHIYDSSASNPQGGIRFFCRNGTATMDTYEPMSITQPMIALNSPVRLANGFHQAYKIFTLSATTNFGPTYSEWVGSYMFINQTGGAWTMQLPAPAGFAGSISYIKNVSSVNLTLSTPSGTFHGNYGSLASTIMIVPQQALVIVGALTNWEVVDVLGVPYSYRRYNSAAQVLTPANSNQTLLFNTDETVTIATSTLYSTNTWMGARLTYSAGIFTNSTGQNMNINVNIFTYASSATNTKYMWIQLNSTRFPTSTSIGWCVLPANTTQSLTSNATFVLASGDSFQVIGQSTLNNINYGTNIANSSLQTAITITRL